MAEVVSEVLPQIPAAMRVSIRLLARTLASPLHFVALYEELIEVRREQPASPVQREIRKAIEDGRADAWADMGRLAKRISAGEVTSGDVLGTRASLKNNYLYRMRGTVAGIWGNVKEEAIYPAYYVALSLWLTARR